MKVMIVLGTRPEIIRLSRVITVLDSLCDLTLVHTGQNYDPNLSDLFFQELIVRPPDVYLGIRASGFAAQVGQIIEKSSALLEEYRPDRLLILGDTNSGLSAIPAARMGTPVFHMEAGNRCYDDRVPEEVNRRLIDHCSTVLMPYTHRSKENLLREGIERHRIFVTGNPICEVLDYYQPQIAHSEVLTRLDVKPQNYFLVTMHRAENVDDPDRLRNLVDGLIAVGEKYDRPLIVSVHPRTRDKIARFQIDTESRFLRMMEPMGFFDFVQLEKNAFCVISDSGTVQEECSIFNIPNVTIRDVTERAETMEVGSNILTGGQRDGLLYAVNVATTLPSDWQAPVEYLEKNVTRAVVKIVLSYFHKPLFSRGFL
jgi:UDP-N-acetylglucosamine 2-epimerase (non-hydrolysing)